MRPRGCSPTSSAGRWSPLAENCPQAWHTGLAVGMLVECRFDPKHRGWHRNGDGSLSWGGRLTEAEQEMATALRVEPR